ncbi:MAG: hypothetical protein ACTSWY_03025 [Promethearchaeota archaeon]
MEHKEFSFLVSHIPLPSTVYVLLEIENNNLGSLTYTPSICFTKKIVQLNKILELPKKEIIQTIIPVGYYLKKPEAGETIYLNKIHLNKYGTPLFEE